MTENPAISTDGADAPPAPLPFGFDPSSLLETQQRQIDTFAAQELPGLLERLQLLGN